MSEPGDTMSATTVSDSQQQPATGQSSTGSSKSSTRSLSEKLKVSLGKLHLMGTMIGWESIRRGMRQEDEMVRREQLAQHSRIHGDATSPVAGEDEMGHLVLGDMTVTHTVSQPPPQQQGGKGRLTKAALLAAGIATGGGAVAAAPTVLDWLRREPETVVVPGETPEPKVIERERRSDFRIGEPIVE